MSKGATMDHFDAYIPMDRRVALARDETLPDRTSGAALFADISGFTPLAEALAQELGPHRGAEELTQQLDRIYGAIIDEVHRYGGSVIGFSGDAITCWFDRDNGRRATACALLTQRAIAPQATLRTPGGSVFRISIKVAVTAGPARRFVVGRRDVQLLDVLAGAILDRLAAAEHQARQGEVVVSADTVQPFAEQVVIREWRSDAAGARVAVVTDLNRAVPPAPWPAGSAVGDDMARDWVLAPVYDRLQSGQGQFLAELRPAVALFLKFSGIDYDRDDAAGKKLDAYIRWVQAVVVRYEGALLQLTMGDKGSYLYMVYGAPIAHEDDAARAASAALELRAPPAELSFIQDIQIGLSRGQMRTGDYGAAAQRAYGVLGTDVNIAARLMTKAQPGQILITPRIAQAIRADFDLREIEEPLVLKGVSEPLKVFTVSGRRREQATYTPKRPSPFTLVGRAEERAVLTAQLQQLLDRQGGSLIIEGEAGMGKSRLVADLLEQAQASAVRILIGEADAIDKSRPYHAWRPIFTRLFNLDPAADDSDRAARERWQTHVLTRLHEIDADLLRLAPLLNAVLPLDFPENELTLQLAGEVRAANTQQLLVRLLHQVAQSAPLLLVLDDGHWLDSTSWALARLVSRDVQPALFVVATRPLPEPPPAEYTYLVKSAGARLISLETLSDGEVDQLVCQRLGVSILPQPVANLIRQKAEGHPFFSEELAYALREAGLIQIVNGECQIAPGVRDLAALDFPDTIQGVITSRIDRLTLQQQLTLKVASVIGRIFAYQTLRDIHPVESDKPYVRDALNILQRLDITPLEAPEPDLTYIFKHIITQEVAYNLMTFSQRRSLHRVVAEWFERAHAADLSPFFPYLAYHWQHTIDDQHAERALVLKAIDYLERAAEQAHLNFANQEVVSFLSDALTLGDHLDQRGQPLRRARWERLLGEAYLGLGQFSKSRQHLERGLALLGQVIPVGRGRLVIGLLGQALQQAGHRLRAGYVSRSQAPEGSLSEPEAIRLEAARAFTLLGNLYYFANEAGPLLYSVLKSLNLAEVVGPSPEVAQAYSNLCVIAGLIPLHSLAETYSQLAQETARNLAHLPTQAFMLIRISLYRVGVGRWREAEADLGEALALTEHLSDRITWIGGAAVMFLVLGRQGKFAQMAQLAAETRALAQRVENAAFEVWGLNAGAYSLLLLGQGDEALRLAEAALALAPEAENADRVARMDTYGILAKICVYQGDLSRVERTVEILEPLVLRASPTNHAALYSYGNLAEAALVLWEAAQLSGFSSKPSKFTPQELEARARRACKALHRYARVFPVAKPAACLRQGAYDWLAGEFGKAHQNWQKALAAAERLEMPYEQGLAHYFIGQHLSADDPARAQHLNRALETFAALGAAYDQARVRASLEHRMKNG
ncbi:MAG TPA: AAA family ATPase [Anaerolineae bacterium]|nr:AAA family ATPase [Anaerolineae bacterium]